MIRVACCDDSKEDIKHIQNLMNHWNASDSFELKCFEDGDSLIQSHTAAPFDILLLDVLMPLLNGIDTAREIRSMDKSVKIVFLTSSIEYAFDSYSVKASNYLLKPVDEKKLFQCLDDLCSEISSSEKTISVSSSGVNHRLIVNDIETLEAQNKHVLFTLKTGRKVVSNEPLHSFEKLLIQESTFYKCHRSYLINLIHIDSYSSKEIIMRTGQRIPLSRTLHKEFENVYFSTLFMKAGENK